MENMEIYNKYRSVPQEAQKTITAGRIKGFTDINSMWRIKCLTEQFGPCGIGWYVDILREYIEVANENEQAAIVDIVLYVKVDGEWSKGICGTGGSMFVTQERSGLHVSDECFKMALTDAISVACKMLGIGADVYWADDRSKYGSADKEDAPVSQAKKENPSYKRDPNQDKWLIGGMAPNYLDSLKAEMDKKFVTEDKILERYGVSKLEELTFAQYKDAMKGLEKTKPPINQPEIPESIDDPELPWNQPSPLEKGDKSKKKTKREQANEAYDTLMGQVENGKFT